MESSSKGLYGMGRVAFKTYLVEIHQEINAGYPLTHIYDKRKEKFGITYSQFAKYVGKYVNGEVFKKPTPEESVKNEPIINAEAKSPKYISQIVTPKKSLHDPTPLPDSELF